MAERNVKFKKRNRKVPLTYFLQRFNQLERYLYRTLLCRYIMKSHRLHCQNGEGERPIKRHRVPVGNGYSRN